MQLIENDTRQPTSWLNYAARVEVDPYKPLGAPNLLGERLWPVAVKRPSPNRTRVGLSLIAPKPKEAP